ncbi:dimethyladenosine transferase 1, mitochondrial [Drosophila guanche]|uniref:rRNA adenine N(6)-methyltransferase n=1 Tax=Drosophila guanche TaxID=7266 RepID=A0A3B0K083_DROGU|nr:dimethyladenosine transferase 1, mitochondrial [Drosophila guanche]SPP76768.1 blast:Dimethyladenosine transferase 1%2C mitochondrial [Drosophila guanche]
MSQATARVLNSGMRLPPLPTIRELVKLYKLQAMKQLSQNFLMDERLTDKIVKSAGRIDPRDIVLEVGPGPGGITRSILRRQPQRLILVEKDRRFGETLQLLRECASPLDMQVDIYYDDILRFNIEQHIPEITQRIHLIGNLPFSISTRLLINWYADLAARRGAFRRNDTCMTLTFQKEVAERICAPVGSEQRCRLSVMSQIWTEPVMKFIIPGKAFVPKPQVDVGVVKLMPLKQPKTQLPFSLVERVMRHIFSMRQKYCRRGYGTLLPPDGREEATQTLFQRADVRDTLRSFELSVPQCLRLADVYAQYIKEHPEVEGYDYRGPKIQDAATPSGDNDFTPVYNVVKCI